VHGLKSAVRNLRRLEPTTNSKALDDCARRARLKALGITDDDFVQYIVARAKGASKDTTLKQLLQNRNIQNGCDSDFIQELAERLPMPE
jgi:hypothetical protein